MHGAAIGAAERQRVVGVFTRAVTALRCSGGSKSASSLPRRRSRATITTAVTAAVRARLGRAAKDGRREGEGRLTCHETTFGQVSSSEQADALGARWANAAAREAAAGLGTGALLRSSCASICRR